MSSSDRVGRAGHGQLIATPLTLALLGARGGGHLGVPLHRKFTLGTLRLELIASGRGPGAAALHVDAAGGPRVLYAGAIRTEVPAAAIASGMEPAGVRACDAVVVTAVFGDDRHRFPPLAEAIDRTLGWVRAQLAAGRRPVLLVDTPLDGLELAGCLAADGLALAGGRAIREAAQRAADSRDGVAVASARAMRDAELRAPERQPRGGPTSAERAPGRAAPSGGAGSAARGRDRIGTPGGDAPMIAPPGREPRAIIWLAGERAGAIKAIGDRAHATALVSGRALDRPSGADAAFAWSSAAGKLELLAWIESTAARDVFVTGPFADEIARAIGPGRAQVIGPPHQMVLFPGEPVEEPRHATEPELR